MKLCRHKKPNPYLPPRLFFFSRRTHVCPQIRAQLLAVSAHLAREGGPSRPANSILAEIAKWQPETYTNAFVDHLRALGGESRDKNVLMAERVLSEGGKLCVLGKMLGEGGFGSVRQMSVLGLDESLAIKNVTVGRVLFFFTLVMDDG